MDLNEIESAADALLEKLASTESAAEVRDLCFRLDGMYRGAQVKAIADARAIHNVAVGLRERELAAMESVANSLPKQAPCGAASPEVVLAGGLLSKQYCRWPSGHAGPHKSPTGAEWSPNCGQRWSWMEADQKHFEICTLPVGHDGVHLNQITEYSSLGADLGEPTKPVADELHQLLSYLVQSSEQTLATSKVVVDGQPEVTGLVEARALAASKAYDDAATKLQEILTEGRI